MKTLLLDWFICFVLSYSHSDGLEEMIIVREMINPNHPVKNAIIVMSDLHLNSIWCHKEEQRIITFIEDLTKISKVNTETRKTRRSVLIMS